MGASADVPIQEFCSDTSHSVSVFGCRCLAEDGVIDQLRMAREYALLGNYETSLVYYDGVVATIQRTMRDEEDPRSKSQWQSVSSFGCRLRTVS